MARTVSEIKEAFATVFLSNQIVQDVWGVGASEIFEEIFSDASIEGLLFDTSSIIVNDLEQLFDRHIDDVNKTTNEKKAHSPRWYANIALLFQKDMQLVSETDYYDNTGLSDFDIEQSKVVKYCAVDVSEDQRELEIKIAGDDNGSRVPLDSNTEVQVTNYFKQVKDAGVKIRLINLSADYCGYSVDLYYDAILVADNVKNAVILAVENYMNNLPFNGEFTNMSLVDSIQSVSGVEVVEHKYSSVEDSQGTLIKYVDAKYKPISGYFTTGTVLINMIPYEL